MTDFIFAQMQNEMLNLDTITFASFGPVSVSQFDSAFSSLSCSSPHNNSFSFPAFMQVENVNLQLVQLHDKNGLYIDTAGITYPSLLLKPTFFGLRYSDSGISLSACASQFHATNIIAIVREGDKGLFVKFRTPLRVCPNADNPSPQSIYDKRFGACISVVLYFYDSGHVQQVFEYIDQNPSLTGLLRQYYPKVMLLSTHCTMSDAHMIAAERQLPSDKLFTVMTPSQKTMELIKTVEEDEFEEDEDDLVVEPKTAPAKSNVSQQIFAKVQAATTLPTTTQQTNGTFKSQSLPRAFSQPAGFGWAKAAAKQKQQLQQQGAMRPKSKSIASSKVLTGCLDKAKLLEVLPSSFFQIAEPVQCFARELLADESLMPYQLTTGLCHVLHFAETQQSQLRAKCVLKRLAGTHAQITKLDSVAKYIVHGKQPPSKNTPSTTLNNGTKNTSPQSC